MRIKLFEEQGLILVPHFHIIVFSLVLLLLCGCNHRKKVDINPGPAQLLFDVSSVELDTLSENELLVDRELVYYNIGSEPLVIHKIDVSCHCTTVSYPKEPIMPGNYGAIMIHLDATGIIGNFTRSITIYSNTAKGEDEISIHGYAPERSSY